MNFTAGTTIKNMRKTHNMTQKDLAQKLHLSVSNISDIENNKKKQLNKIDNIDSILDTFNIDFDYLFRNELSVFNSKEIPDFIQKLEYELRQMDKDKIEAFHEYIDILLKYLKDKNI